MSVTTDNDGSHARAARFKADVSDMRLRDPATGLDRLLLRLGVLGMIAGPVLAVLGYFMAHSATGGLQQRDAIVQAIVGLCLSVVGAALYVKAAITSFLRFWMARFVYEQRAQATKSDIMT